jgi:hypothetical protein
MKDADCYPIDATSMMPAPDQCKNYACQPDYSCLITDIPSCMPVVPCALGTYVVV